MDLPVEVALARIRGREAEGPNEFEKRDMLERVKGIFDGLDWPEIRRVDGTLPVEAQQRQIRNWMTDLMGRKRNIRGDVT